MTWSQMTIERRRPGLVNSLRRSLYPWLQPQRSLAPTLVGILIGLSLIMMHDLSTSWKTKQRLDGSFDATLWMTPTQSAHESTDWTMP